MNLTKKQILIKTLLFASLVLIGPVVCAALSCRQYLGQSQQQSSLYFPKDLHISADFIAYMQRNDTHKVVEMTSNLFTRFETDPVFANQVGNSFREHQINQSPQRSKIFGFKSGDFKGFEKKVTAINFNKEVSKEDLIKLWNIHQALTKNLDSGYLRNEKEVILLSLFFLKDFEKLKFKPNDGRSIFGDGQSFNYDTVAQKTGLVLREAKLRTALNALIKDKGFARAIEGNLFTISMEYKKIASKFGKKSFNLNQQHGEIIASVSVILINEIVGGGNSLQSFKASFSQATGKLRSAYINAVETFLFENLQDRSHIPELLELMDYMYFSTPLSLSQSQVSQLSERGAKYFFLPHKNSYISEVQERNKSQTLIISPSEKSTYNIVNRIESPQPSLNPNKRKNQRGRDQRQRSKQESLPRELVQEAFPQDLVPLAEQNYSFNFIRQSHLGEQKVRFSENVINEMNRQNINWNSFLKPLNYGFTSSSGQSGIKNLGTNNAKVNDIFEIRPGHSSYRMVMTKKNGAWYVLDLVHKDQMQSYMIKH